MLKYIHKREEYLEQHAAFQLTYSHVINILTYYLDCIRCKYYFYYSAMFTVQPLHTFLLVPHKLASILKPYSQLCQESWSILKPHDHLFST